MSDSELVTEFAKRFRIIAMDVGYKIPSDKKDWNFICTRIMDFLKKYFSYMSVEDVRLAFELSASTEIDRYFRNDSFGNPEKNHYQQFNIDYFSRVLKAYDKKRREVIGKAYKLLPEPNNAYHDARKKAFINYLVAKHRRIFLKYKYTGILELTVADEKHVFDWLYRYRLADDVYITDEDRRKAYYKAIKRISQGMVNEFTVFSIRDKGEKSDKLDFSSQKVAQIREIKRAFDYMIKKELYIDNYIKFEL